jgi:phage gp36-like protein
MGSYNPSFAQQYATTADLANTMSAQALAHPSTGTTQQNAQLLRASEFVDGYLRDQFVLPLTFWSSDVVQAVCDIAAYRLVCLRGFNPEKDGLYKDNFDSTIRWLEGIAKGHIAPDVTDASSGSTPGESAPGSAPLAYSPVPVKPWGTPTRGAWRR